MQHDSAAAMGWFAGVLLQRMQLARSQGRKLRRPRGRAYRPKLPQGVERRYADFISGLMTEIYSAGGLLPGEQRHDGVIADWQHSMNRMREAMRKIFEEQGGNTLVTVQRFGDDINAWNGREWRKTLAPYIGTDFYPPGDPLVKQVTEAWAAENFARIKTLGASQIEELNAVMVQAASQGASIRDIRKALEAVNGKYTGWRSDLLARDQAGKLNGEMTRIRATSAGLEKYIWRGTLDQRERLAHYEMEGQVRVWGVGIIPGEEILCRCTSEPVIDDIWNACAEEVYE